MAKETVLLLKAEVTESPRDAMPLNENAYAAEG